jgi:cobalt-precorrin-6B (C15)-methyltransferase
VKNLHIYDKDFVQGELPMTKQEVRAVTVAKLQLKPNSILIDVGAGTGTIGIECATYISNGKVIGIEKEEKGLETIKENIKKFNLTNYELIHGRAPEAIPNIAYDRMFIGGSTGSMKNILEHFIKYSTVDARLVINTITLESLNDTMSLLKEYGFKDIEVVNMMVSRGKKIGPYTMMYGENPIYIITVDKNSL